MKKKILFLLTGVILLAGLLYAKTDVTMQLSTSDGSSVVSFKNSNGIVVSSVTSTGEVFVNTFSVRASTFVVKNGNVGIGTANPSKKLDINGDINFNGTLYQNNSAYVGSQWETTGSNISYDSGNVGIGTTSPAAQLHTTGTVRFTNYPSGANGAILKTDGTGNLSTTNFTGNASQVLLGNATFGTANTSGTAWQLTGNAAAAANFIGTSNAIDFRIYTSNAERMTVEANGNVGIGTTGPVTLLHVNGLTTLNNAGRFIANGNGFYFGEQSAAYRNPATNIPGVVIRMDESNAGLDETKASLVLYNANGGLNTGAGLTFASREAVGAGNDVALSGIFGIKETAGTAGGWSSGGLRFWTKDQGNIVEAMAIDNDGNVGIGTTSPGDKLVVNGPTGIRITDGSYNANLVFGANDTWKSGIRTYDNGDAEMRIWHGNADGQIILTTGYNGDQSTAYPTDGLFMHGNKVGIGYTGTQVRDGSAKFSVNGNVGIGTTSPGRNCKSTEI